VPSYGNSLLQGKRIARNRKNGGKFVKREGTPATKWVKREVPLVTIVPLEEDTPGEKGGVAIQPYARRLEIHGATGGRRGW